MCREMPRGRGTTTSSPHSSSERCHGRVTRAGLGFVATMRSAMAPQPSPGGSGAAAPGRPLPGRAGATSSSGLLSAQVRRLRQPQPMQPSSLSRSRSSRSIWASIRGRQPRESRAQSALVGVRPSGSVASASRISSRVRPTRCAERMNATRRRVARRVPALVAGRALGLDQALRLVVAQRRGRHAGALGQLADGEVRDSHGPTVPRPSSTSREARTEWSDRLAPPVQGSVLERVLHLLAGLLEVGLALVLLALGLEVSVVGRVAELLLGLAGRLSPLLAILSSLPMSSSSLGAIHYPASRQRMRPVRIRLPAPGRLPWARITRPPL